MDAVDSDVMIYAAIEGHSLGDRVRRLLLTATRGTCIGSELLVPEVLIKPNRLGLDAELADLRALLALLQLHEVDRRTAELAVVLGARHGLKTVDAIHLATAVNAGADRFVTNNRREFSKDISEVDVTYPDDLPEP